MELHEIARDNAGMFGEYVIDVVNDAGHWAMHKALDTCKRVVVRTPPGVGVTTLLIGRMLHEIGRDPSVRIAYVAPTYYQGRTIGAMVTKYLQTKEFKTVFGDIDTSQWSAGRPVEYLTPGSNILHARFDLVVMDDILDPATRYSLAEWWRTLRTRVVPSGRVWAAGQTATIDDFYHQLVWRDGFEYVPIPLVAELPLQVCAVIGANSSTTHIPLRDPSTEVPHWPHAWPHSRVRQERSHLGGVTSATFLDCKTLVPDRRPDFGDLTVEQFVRLNKMLAHAVVDPLNGPQPTLERASLILDPREYRSLADWALSAPLERYRWEKDIVSTNHFGERVWLTPAYDDKGQRIGITDCCLEEEPCAKHATCAITDTGSLACGSEGGAGVLGTNVLHDVTCHGCEPYAVRMIRHEAVPYIDAMLRADARGFPPFADARRATVLAVMESFRKPRPVMFLLRYVAVLIAAMHVHEHFCCGTAPIRDCDRVKTPEMYFYRKARGHFRTTDTTEGINHISEQLLHNNPTNAYLVMVAVSPSLDGADIHYTKAMEMAQMHLDYLARVNTVAASKPSTAV